MAIDPIAAVGLVAGVTAIAGYVKSTQTPNSTATTQDNVTVSNNQNLPLTVRLNNPGALEFVSANNWQGEIRPSSHSRFTEFSSAEFGARALMITMRTRYNRGLQTIGDQIFAHAPSFENDTFAYIDFVTLKTGISHSAIFPFERETVARIAHAIGVYETGYEAFSLDLFLETFDRHLGGAAFV